MTPSASLLTFIADTGLAGLALAFFKDFAEACRPIAKAFLTESTQVVIPRRRALLTDLLRHLRHVALPVFSFEHREIPACRKSFPAGRK